MTLFFLILAAIAAYYLFIYRDSGKYRFFKGREKSCPNCKNPVEESFNVCPVCKETLKKKCSNCGERVDAAWKFCPFCEKSLDRVETNEAKNQG